METPKRSIPPKGHLQSPHSLGKLIEWKLESYLPRFVVMPKCDATSHSLGKLIEWKLEILYRQRYFFG